MRRDRPPAGTPEEVRGGLPPGISGFLVFSGRAGTVEVHYIGAMLPPMIVVGS